MKIKYYWNGVATKFIICKILKYKINNLKTNFSNKWNKLQNVWKENITRALYPLVQSKRNQNIKLYFLVTIYQNIIKKENKL